MRSAIRRRIAEAEAQENAALRKVVEDYLITNWDALPKLSEPDAEKEWRHVIAQAVENRKHEVLDPAISLQAKKAATLDWLSKQPNIELHINQDGKWVLYRESFYPEFVGNSIVAVCQQAIEWHERERIVLSKDPA